MAAAEKGIGRQVWEGITNSAVELLAKTTAVRYLAKAQAWCERNRLGFVYKGLEITAGALIFSLLNSTPVPFLWSLGLAALTWYLVSRATDRVQVTI